jgi:hypothetical protein
MDARSLNLGYLLGLLSGAVLGYSWAEGGGVIVSVVGLLVAVLGALVVLYGLTRARVAESASQYAYEPGGEWDWTAAPPLGQMLVNYKLITEADLNRALDRQRRKRQRLGKVLVDMKLVTHAQVAQVLEEQFSRRRHSKTEIERDW